MGLVGGFKLVKFGNNADSDNTYSLVSNKLMKNHDLETYAKLAEGAKFFLDESFKYIDETLKSETASLIYSKLLEKIEPNDEDLEIINTSEFSNNTIELLQSEIGKVLSDETHEAFTTAWEDANIIAQKYAVKHPLAHKINSIEILGHLNNLGFFIETLTNRHLLFLCQSKIIDDFSYSRISLAKIMERLIFIFKDDIINKKVHLNEIANLFSLRNKTVHYTPDNSVALKPTISELIQIWVQCKKIIEKFEKIEKINEYKFSTQINDYIIDFKKKWTQ
ncbi:hypothetical protein IVB69_12690 [Flavobacterium sp. J49]|uniref:hypothetical protein n=1 Tax=Flavobacterium sp. J49 TaxID=2718534 RepID=UPI0015935C2F|nr:hypothetical protein [Flavobacterium sp. J49]MBF6642341.1 hypothetical protein [Flavobacterium sp. J49]NIC03587.1 hypothetical protein [Flavobacterium sp. J49]